MIRFKPLILTGLFLLTLMISLGGASAHPADEVCAKDKQMDPAFCAALQAAHDGKPAQIAPTRPFVETVRVYLKLGYIHILPRGLDHILFVLALFLATTRWRPLLLQISIFTIAHTLTLILAASGKIAVPATLVEPLIAISIAFVAIENLYFKEISRWRPFIVFGFGMIHGLGFAGVLADMGLPQDQFLPALISFNIGVELGQISVVMVAWSLLHWFFKRRWYRAFIVRPVSLLIAATGLIWAVQRIFFLS